MDNKIDAEVIGKLCMETECYDGIVSMDVLALVGHEPSAAVAQLARACGELFEQMQGRPERIRRGHLADRARLTREENVIHKGETIYEEGEEFEACAFCEGDESIW